jgi:serine/threonine protein kinase
MKPSCQSFAEKTRSWQLTANQSNGAKECYRIFESIKRLTCATELTNSFEKRTSPLVAIRITFRIIPAAIAVANLHSKTGTSFFVSLSKKVMEIGPDDLEIFSSLEPDVPTNGFRQFGSYFGELVLVTEFTCADDVDRSLIADRIHEVSNSLQEGVIFETRQVDIAHSNTITSLILYPEGGFLSQLLFSDINIGWYFRLKIALDIARALGSLHEINYVHNDLRSSVLGLDCEWHCRFLELPRLQKLGDIFVPEKPAPGISGDKRYFAPEVILHSFCSSASDMYSFGLLLFEICARVAAFSITRDEETQVVDVEELLDCLPSSTPESLQQLIRQLLGPEAEYRPTVEDTIDWLDSLIMETSTVDDPGEPPLPPLPFSQVRKSSKHTKGSKAIGITPKDAERLREIAQKTRESQARIADAIKVDSEITSESLAEHDSFSPVPNDRRFFFPQQGPEDNDEDDQNEDEVRASIANQKAHDTIVAALGISSSTHIALMSLSQGEMQ